MATRTHWVCQAAMVSSLNAALELAFSMVEPRSIGSALAELCRLADPNQPKRGFLSQLGLRHSTAVTRTAGRRHAGAS